MFTIYPHSKRINHVNQANEHTTKLEWWKVPSLAQFVLPVDSTKQHEIANNADTIRDIAILRRTHLYMHETLRITGILLKPFMPSKSEQILDALGVSTTAGRAWDDAVLGGRSWAPNTAGKEMTIEEESSRYDVAKAVLFPPLEGNGNKYAGKARNTR